MNSIIPIPSRKNLREWKNIETLDAISIIITTKRKERQEEIKKMSPLKSTETKTGAVARKSVGFKC